MSKYEPEPRFNHYIASVGKKCYLYGGCCSYKSSSSSSLNFIEVFDQEMRTWTKHSLVFKDCLSDIGRRRGACCSLSSGDIYMYGGFCGLELSNHLFKLSTKPLKLTKLSPGGDIKPLKKGGCRMVAFHRTKLALYGGQNFREGIITNEFHIYDTLTGKLRVHVSIGRNISRVCFCLKCTRNMTVRASMKQGCMRSRFPWQKQFQGNCIAVTSIPFHCKSYFNTNILLYQMRSASIV